MTTIIFCTALSDYDQVLVEGGGVVRLSAPSFHYPFSVLRLFLSLFRCPYFFFMARRGVPRKLPAPVDGTCYEVYLARAPVPIPSFFSVLLPHSFPFFPSFLSFRPSHPFADHTFFSSFHPSANNAPSTPTDPPTRLARPLRLCGQLTLVPPHERHPLPQQGRRV